MRKLVTFASAFAMTFAFGANAFANSPDIYVVNFRSDKNAESQKLDRELSAALSMVGNAEHVVIDTSNAAKWEKSAHEAFDRDIVPVFNKWVGLPGFAAIVDARSKRVMGCVNGGFSSVEIANEIRKMSAQSNNRAYLSKASTSSKSTNCPDRYNEDPGF